MKADLQFWKEVQLICFRHYETNHGLQCTAPHTGSVLSYLYESSPLLAQEAFYQ